MVNVFDNTLKVTIYFFVRQNGIRTRDRLTPILVFKTSALNHSAICPVINLYYTIS